MSEIDTSEILSQLRSLAAKAQSVQDVNQSNATQHVDFSNLLKQSIDSVNEVQQNSGDLKKRFELGDQSVNLVDVTIASEKAKVAFTAMTEVRNKLIKAYQDIMNMPI